MLGLETVVHTTRPTICGVELLKVRSQETKILLGQLNFLRGYAYRKLRVIPNLAPDKRGKTIRTGQPFRVWSCIDFDHDSRIRTTVQFDRPVADTLILVHEQQQFFRQKVLRASAVPIVEWLPKLLNGEG